MYINFANKIWDFDLTRLTETSTSFDSKLERLEELINDCDDPDMMGYFAKAEYYAGMAFVAIQVYMSNAFGPKSMTKNIALNVGRSHANGETYARILNAAANYAKHSGEWDRTAVINRDPTQLDLPANKTIQIIETVVPWSDYVCANLLAALTAPDAARVANLMPIIEDWRQDVIDYCRKRRLIH